MPAADRPLMVRLSLAPQILITPDPGPPPWTAFLERLEHVLAAGVRCLSLRAHHLSAADYRRLARLVLAAAAPYHAKVFLYGAGGDVLALGAHGLHLTGRELAATTGRTLARHGFVLASCHNRAELAHAEAVGVDLALLGPVLPTTTHPETDPLGWATAAGLIQGRHLPVYALGGMTPADAGTARDHGFAGLAMVRGLWRGGS